MKGERKKKERERHAANATIEQRLTTDAIHQRKRDRCGEYIQKGQKEGGKDCGFVGSDASQQEDLRSVMMPVTCCRTVNPKAMNKAQRALGLNNARQ